MITALPVLNKIVVQNGIVKIIAVAQQGPAGVNGVGVPAGGTTGQVLAKLSNTDYATGWQNAATSPVQSVFGRTGAIVAESGDYNTSEVTEGSNLYFTNARVQTYIDTIAGAANGLATLDSSGKVPLSQIPPVLIGALEYQGTWNASTNTPTLTSSVGTKGFYYVVSVAGTTNLNGITDWNVNDWAVYNGTAWQKIDNTDLVTSVNGQTGTVVLTAADVGAATAAQGAKADTAVQPGDLAEVAFTGDYDNLINLPWLRSGNNIYNNFSGNAGFGTNTPATRIDAYDNSTVIAAPSHLTVSLLAEVLIAAPSDTPSFIYGSEDPSSGNANENFGSGSIYVSNGQNWNYTAYAYRIIGGIKYVSPGATQINFQEQEDDGVTNFTVSVGWSASTNGDNSPVDGYILTGPFGSVDVGSATNYTDDGSSQSVAYQSFGGITASGQTFDFTPYNLAFPFGDVASLYSSVGGSVSTLVETQNNGSQFWIAHDLTGNSGTGWQSVLIYDSDANGYTTTTDNLFYQKTALGGGANPYPFHYGIQANGSNLNQVFHAFSKQASPLLFSTAFASATTVDPDDLGYYYFDFTLADFGDGTSARLLQNVNSAGFNNYHDASGLTFHYTALGSFWSAGSTVTPNEIPNITATFNNSAASVSDPVQIMANTTNSFGSAGYGISLNGTQIADWRWNPYTGTIRFNNNVNGWFDFTQGNTVLNSIGSNFFTLNKGQQNYFHFQILNTDGSSFFECQTVNNIFRFGGSGSGTSPFLSVLIPSGNTGLSMKKVDSSGQPFLDFYDSSNNNIFRVNNLGYVYTPQITNANAGFNIGQSNSDKWAAFGGTPHIQPTGDIIVGLGSAGLNLIASPTIAASAISTDSTLHVSGGNLGFNLAHANTWSALQSFANISITPLTTGSSDVPLLVKQNAGGGFANLSEWRNSSNILIAAVSYGGVISGQGLNMNSIETSAINDQSNNEVIDVTNRILQDSNGTSVDWTNRILYKNDGTTSTLNYNTRALIGAWSTAALTVGGNLTLSAHNIVTDTTTGMIIGTATGQKISLWNKTPIVQPTTSITAATFVANSGTTINSASTFGGYTLAKIAAALINIGILA